VLRLYAIKCAMHYHLHVLIWQRRNIGMGVDIDWSGGAAPRAGERPAA
jgi:hypothetical protein